MLMVILLILIVIIIILMVIFLILMVILLILIAIILLCVSSAQKREPGPGLWSITNNMDVLDDNMSKKFKTKSNLSEIGKRGLLN